VTVWPLVRVVVIAALLGSCGRKNFDLVADANPPDACVPACTGVRCGDPDGCGGTWPAAKIDDRLAQLRQRKSITDYRARFAATGCCPEHMRAWDAEIRRTRVPRAASSAQPLVADRTSGCSELFRGVATGAANNHETAPTRRCLSRMPYRDDVAARQLRLRDIAKEVGEIDELVDAVEELKEQKRDLVDEALRLTGGPGPRRRGGRRVAIGAIATLYGALLALPTASAAQATSRAAQVGPFGAVLAKFGALSAQMCQCKDKRCADGVQTTMTRWSVQMAQRPPRHPERPDPAVLRKMTALGQRYAECMMKAMTVVEPADLQLPDECRQYGSAIHELDQCQAMPSAKRDALREAYEQVQAALIGVPPEGYAALASACKAADMGVRQTIQASCHGKWGRTPFPR